ncbi:MAG: glycosyltransferase family 4 protein [Anaerolineales bacterium]
MRVCIPVRFLPQGGGFYFLDAFSNYLRQIGWEVTQDLGSKYDVLFTNHWMTPYSDILRAIRRNPKVRIVQRIDGAAQNYGRPAEADERQARVNTIADLTIFQSQYARASTREIFRVIKQDGPIIYNPVDLYTFRSGGERKRFSRQAQVAAVTWSTNSFKGLGKIYAVASSHPDVDFVLCGSFKDAPDLPNVHKLGLLDRKELAVALRSCQVLLTFSKNEACPNHVLEAMACGLPVLYEDSGAMREVISECGFSVTVESFADGLGKALGKLEELSRAAQQRAQELFNPNKNFNQYTTSILEATARRTHIPAFRRTAIAWAYPVLQRLGVA